MTGNGSYDDFLEATGNPQHPEYEMLTDWIGGLVVPKSSVYDQVARQSEHLEQQRPWQPEHVSYERVVLGE
jgi:hypothetical protein